MKPYPLRKAGFYPFDSEFRGIEYIVMASFFPEADGKTIKELEERSGYSYERVYTTLKALESKGIVTEKKIGKTLTYKITTRHDAVQLAFIHFSLVKKAEFSKIYPHVSKALNDFLGKVNVDTAIIFGSYAKSEAKKSSDIDLLCVSQEKDIEGIALSMRHKYNLRINPVIVGFKDFKNIKTENPELWQELLEFGVIFRGYEFFYYAVYR